MGKHKTIDQQIRARAIQWQEWAKKQGQTVSFRQAKYMVLADMFEDLNDGAYWQAFKDHGYSEQDVVNINNELFEKGIVRE